MTKIKLLIGIILLSFLFGCSNEEDSIVQIRKWYYDDGNLKKVQEFINDTTEQGVYLFYYPNGVLKDSAQIINNKFEGKRHQYYKSGNLQTETTYFNNKYRDAIEYRDNGTIEFYRAYNYFKELSFIAHYDGDGKFIKNEGNLFYTWFIKDTVNIGQDFNVELLVACPPNTFMEISVNDWDQTEAVVLSKKEYVLDEFNRINYSKLQNAKVETNILHIANIKDVNSQMIISDTLLITVDKNGVTSYSR